MGDGEEMEWEAEGCSGTSTVRGPAIYTNRL